MPWYKNYTLIIFGQCESLCAEIIDMFEKMPWYKIYIGMGFSQNESLGDEMKYIAEKITWNISYIWIFTPVQFLIWNSFPVE